MGVHVTFVHQVLYGVFGVDVYDDQGSQGDPGLLGKLAPYQLHNVCQLGGRGRGREGERGGRKGGMEGGREAEDELMIGIVQLSNG